MSLLLSKLFLFVQHIISINNIDESHSLGHSMNVLHLSNNIFKNEIIKNPLLEEQKKIIFISSIIHDMCDNKYMNVDDGIEKIDIYLKEEDEIEHDEKEIIKQIITTISYNKVKKNGFPDLGKYQLAYHIVREADLLSAYDFDRCMCYQMHKTNCDIYDAFINANNLFEKRMFRHNEDGLFITDYSKKESIILHTNSIKRIAAWKSILKIP